MFRARIALLALVFLAPAMTGRAFATDAVDKNGTGYAIDWHTIDGGGGVSSGGGFRVEGTIGQPDVDPLQPSSAAGFELTGGYWAGFPSSAGSDVIFRHGFESM